MGCACENKKENGRHSQYEDACKEGGPNGG